LSVRNQSLVGHGSSNQSLNLPVMGMDSAVDQAEHLRSDVSTAVLFFQQPSIHRKHVRKLVFVCTAKLSPLTRVQVPSERLLKRRTLLERDVSTSRQPPRLVTFLPHHTTFDATCWLPIRSLHG